MHFEVLIEDKSGEIAVKYFLAKILGPNGQPHTYRTHHYRGIGRLPSDLRGKTDPQKRILLDRLPKVLQGYGKSLSYNDSAVIVIVDLDKNDCIQFKQELLDVLQNCNPKPRALFRIAIEELEAWFFGDREALQAAYPMAKENVLDEYIQDSICDTWEKLAEAIYPRGADALKKQGYPLIGKEKCAWSEKIAPYVDIHRNQSKSFQAFRDGVRKLAGIM